VLVDDRGEASSEVHDGPVLISDWDWFAEVRTAVPEAVIDEYLYVSGELILHMIVFELLLFGVAAFEQGDLEVVRRLLSVMERGLLLGDFYVEDCIAVSFVQKAWYSGLDPFIETWPKGLVDELERQRNAAP
jgi:hypothetical protein